MATPLFVLNGLLLAREMIDLIGAPNDEEVLMTILDQIAFDALIRQLQAQLQMCHDCNRQTNLPNKKVGLCPGCTCVSCGKCAHMVHIKKQRDMPITCNSDCCRVLAENIPDLKKQWFAFRCLNKSFRNLFEQQVLPQPLLQTDLGGIVVRDFLKENIDDMNTFFCEFMLSRHEAN